MKEKNKKFLKALGVGAVATLGLFTMAGCSFGGNADIINGIDKANANLEKTINQLKEENRELKKQNDILLNQNDLVNQQLLVDRAWGLLQTAQAKLTLNIDGLRDNLVLESTYQGGVNTVSYYKTQTEDYIIDQQCGSEDIFYQESGIGIVYKYCSNVTHGPTKEETMYADIESLICDFGYFNLLTDFNKENVTSVEVLENGNYKVNLVYNRSELLENKAQVVSLIYEVIVTPNAKYKEISISRIMVQKNAGVSSDAYSFIDLNQIEFKYGEVDVDDILTKFAEAKECTSGQ